MVCIRNIATQIHNWSCKMFDCSCHSVVERCTSIRGHTSLGPRFDTQIDMPMWLTLIQMDIYRVSRSRSSDHVDSYFEWRLVISVPSCPIFDLTTYAHIYVYNQKNRFYFHKLSRQTIIQLSVGLAINKGVCEPDVSEWSSSAPYPATFTPTYTLRSAR